MTEQYELGWCNDCGSALYEGDDYIKCQQCGEILCNNDDCGVKFTPNEQHQYLICRECEDKIEGEIKDDTT